MKKILWLPIITMLAMSMACAVSGPDFFDSERISGSGDLVTLDQDFTDFDKLQIGYAFDVEVRQGDEYSVVIRIDDNLVDYLVVDKRGDELRIRLEPNRRYDDATLEAEIAMPELTAIDLSGASRANLTGFSSSMAFQADISGASALRGDIIAGNTGMDVSGAGSVDLSGSSSNLDVEASGGSNIDLADFLVGDATVNASGASVVIVKVSETLDVDASGASTVEYLGSPTLGSIETSGASSVDAR